MKFLCSEKISSHKYKTPEGYLVCVDSVLARTGKQTYKRSEIFGCDCKDAENEVDVDRPAEEVFSDKTLASFENKPLTIEHPDEDVNTSNHRDLAVGFARDIKRGKDNGQDVMLGTLVFTDEDAINAIESGEMVELSCGYDADIVDEDNPCQRNIRGNHIALCQRGRAGNARIVDSKVKDSFRTEFETFLKSKTEFKGPKISTNYYIYTMKRPYYTTIGEIRTWLQNKNVNFKIDKFPDDVDILISKQNMQDSVKDDKLSDLKVVLRSISSMQRRDLDIEDIMRTLRNAGFKSTVEKIEGWTANQNVPGEQIKNYTLNIEDLNKRVLVTFYADMGKWKTKEINAYLVDSIKDDSLQKGKTYIAESGATLKVIDYDCSFSDYNGEATVFITYEYVSASGNKRGRSRASSHDFWKMLTDKSLTGDSVKDAGLHQEQLAQQEYDKTKKRLDYLYEQRRRAANNYYSGEHFEYEIAILEKKIAKLKKDFGYALGDSMKDGRLAEVPPSTIMAFEGKVNGANIHIDSKGRTWSGRLHYQLSYDASKASFDTFVKELQRLESWLESIDIPVTFSANTDGKQHTAGFDIDKQWVRDCSTQDWDEDDDDDLSKAEKELCDYMLENVYEKGMTPEQLLKKMESYYSMYPRLARHKPEDVKEYFREEIRYGKYDSLKDVDTYEEATKGLKEQAKKEMKDEWSGSFDGYIFSYNSKDDTYLITSPSGKQYRVRADKLTPQDAIKKVKLLKDSKEDILQKIRTSQIREGDTFEMRDGQYLVQIQNVGNQTFEFRNGDFRTGRVSIKTSSFAWGRIWKNGTIVFNETDALNIVRDKMIQFMKSVRDSKRR